jgi:hypothetical protein
VATGAAVLQAVTNHSSKAELVTRQVIEVPKEGGESRENNDFEAGKRMYDLLRSEQPGAGE